MNSVQTVYGFSRSSRIISSDDFGRILRSQDPGSLRLGRDSVSVCTTMCAQAGRVRFGFTVGKSNVPRSVDRALVKRIMRECSRHMLPEFAAVCKENGVGMDISLRLRSPLREVGRKITVADAKESVRSATDNCLRSLIKRLPKAIREFKE